MFLPHFTTVCSDSSSTPDRWIVMMHGIYGRGGNWRTVARKLTAQCPNWGVLLVDLRMHGRSLGAPPPHTLDACAADVLALIDSQADEGRDVRLILGHSFGGKVALQMLAQRPEVAPVWLVDSSPSARPGAMDDSSNTVVSVLRMLEGLPEFFADRQAFVDQVRAHGFPPGLAQWLAMNLESIDSQYRSTLDPKAMASLLSDYFARDLWSVVENSSQTIHVAIATRGSAISAEDRERLRACDRVRAHDVEGGHWLHVDALDALVALVAGTCD